MAEVGSRKAIDADKECVAGRIQATGTNNLAHRLRRLVRCFQQMADNQAALIKIEGQVSFLIVNLVPSLLLSHIPPC